MVTESTITCPYCNFSKEEEMSLGIREAQYTCTRCARTLRSKEGECCVFCAYGSVICPSQQEKRHCCSG